MNNIEDLVNGIELDCIEHEWWCFSTCITTVELMLSCRKCNAFAVVENPTIEEWKIAFYAPSNPFKFPTDDNRIVVKRQGAP